MPSCISTYEFVPEVLAKAQQSTLQRQHDSANKTLKHASSNCKYCNGIESKFICVK